MQWFFRKLTEGNKCRNPKARSEWELRIKNVENVIRYTVKCNKVCDDANMSSKGLLESVPWGLVFVGKRMSSRKSPRSNAVTTETEEGKKKKVLHLVHRRRVIQGYCPTESKTNYY